MTLYCQEHDRTSAGHPFRTTDVVFCVTTATADEYSAVCATIIEAIPRSERSQPPIAYGIDIHLGRSRPLPGGSELSVGDLEKGPRLFSITRQTAMRYLPQTTRMYL